MATTPCAGASPSSARSAVMKAAKVLANSLGSSSRNRRLKVSWLGGPYGSSTVAQSSFLRAFTKSATCTQLLAPHSVAARVKNNTVPTGCRALMSRGSRTSRRIEMKDCIGPPPQRESHNRISQIVIRKTGFTHMQSPCPERGEGRGGGQDADDRKTIPTRFASRTDLPFSRGGMPHGQH